MLEQHHRALDLPILLSDARRAELFGVGAGGVDEGEALGSVLVGVLQVVAHYSLILKLSSIDLNQSYM